MEAVNDFVIGAAGEPWIYAVLLALCIIDGFFPPVPSESVVVALAALSASTNGPEAWAVVAVSAIGAFTGDNIAYLIGRQVGTERFRWMQRARVISAFTWARRELDRRGALLILTARYIPVGRVAVNMTAGATGFGHRKFIGLSALAGISWSLYSVGIGLAAGAWAKDYPLLGAALAIVLALTLGLIIDRIIRTVTRNRPAGPA